MTRALAASLAALLGACVVATLSALAYIRHLENR